MTDTRSHLPDMAAGPTIRRGDTEITLLHRASTAPGPPIVLVPDLCSVGALEFWALAPMLATRHPVLALDIRSSTADPLEAAAAVREALEEAGGGGPLRIVANSSGVAGTIAAVSDRPDLVDTLVLIGGWAATDQHQRLSADLARNLSEGSSAAAAWRALSSFSADFLNTRTPGEVQSLTERTGTYRSSSSEGFDITALLPQITAPTLVIGCAHDAVAPPRHSRILFGAIPQARYAQIAAGHQVLTERPSEVFDLIDRVLRAPERHPAGSIIPNLHA